MSVQEVIDTAALLTIDELLRLLAYVLDIVDSSVAAKSYALALAA